MELDNTLAYRKKLLRDLLKTLRSSLPAALRAEFSQIIAERLFQMEEVMSAKVFFTYISCGAEVETRGIIRRLLAEGKSVTVPRIADKRMEARAFTSWDELSPGELGIPTPQSGHEYQGQIDVVITPGLGFTVKGHRIGFGRGYYDQWFSSHPAGFKVALAYEAQIVEDVPLDPHDVPVDCIVTEKRVIWTISAG
jgi:5-formyltetrahydrofolate cyclo-ligase